MAKSPRRIAGRSHDQDLAAIRRQTGANRIGFGLFERAGAHPRPDFREITVESDIKIGHPKSLGQTFALVSDWRAGTGQCPLDGQPVGKAVDSTAFRFDINLFFLVFSPDQRGLFRKFVIDGPTGIFKNPACGHCPQAVFRSLEIFHTLLFSIPLEMLLPPERTRPEKQTTCKFRYKSQFICQRNKKNSESRVQSQSPGEAERKLSLLGFAKAKGFGVANLRRSQR